jgi:hypothetical protein
MRISDEALNEFMEFYRSEFGEEITPKDASEMALRVLRLYDLLARKPPSRKVAEVAVIPPSDDGRQIGFRT